MRPASLADGARCREVSAAGSGRLTRAQAGGAGYGGRMSDDPFWLGLLDVPAPGPEGAGPLAPPDGGGALRVADTDLPSLAPRVATDGPPVPVALVLTGGAGQVAGPAARCAREPGLDLRRVELALRDPGDLAGNARRVVAAVDAARAEGSLPEETRVHVAIPDDGGPVPGGPGHGWLAAADELAAAELALSLTATGPPESVVARIDAALDREAPFTAAADGGDALLALLAATTLAFDGDPEGAAAALSGRSPDEVTDPAALARARRWLRAAAVPDPAAALAAYRRVAPAAAS